MGRVVTSIVVTNHIDEILADRGLLDPDAIRSLELDGVLVDTGATRLCLPADAIAQLGLSLVGEVRGVTVVGSHQFRLFKDVTVSVCGRQGRYDCLELATGEEPILGLIPLEDLGLEPDLRNQRLRVLPNEGKENYIRV